MEGALFLVGAMDMEVTDITVIAGLGIVVGFLGFGGRINLETINEI